MDASPTEHRLTLGATRELLLPATVLSCFALYYWAELPFGVVLACAAPMLALYALAPLWAASSLARFDRDSVALLAARDPRRLRARYRRGLGMRLFAPPALLSERRAMVLLECGDLRAARHAYRDVIDELGSGAPPRAVLGYAHASFALGDDDTAIAMYRRIIERVGALPGVERKLAHALVRKGQELDTALSLLERTAPEVDGAESRDELLLLRALGHAKRGEPEQARALLAQASSQTESTEALRAEIARCLEGVATARA